MNNKIPFAYKDNMMVDVGDVKSGKACGCICPSCKELLQARKGKVKAYHFAHLPGSKTECEFAPEIAVYLMAKQILKEEKQIILPSLTINVIENDRARKVYRETAEVCKIVAVAFDSVETSNEKDMASPDVLCRKSGKSIYIEVSVQNLISKSKTTLVRENNTPLVEIDLTGFLKSNKFSKRGLKELVINDLSNKKWIHHPNYQAAKAKLKEQLTQTIKTSNDAIDKELRKKRERIIEFEKQKSANSESEEESTPIESSSSNNKILKKSTNTKSNNMRYLVCDFCRYLIEVPKSEKVEHIDCPQCKREVSQQIINLGLSN